MVFDPDTVELHNLPNQLFPFDEATIGVKKVDVLHDVVLYLTGKEIKPVPELFDPGRTQDIVISGVDSMSARKSIWDSIKDCPFLELYVDGRMGGQVGMLLHTNPSDSDMCKAYEDTLYSDSQASELPCTARSICYTQFGLASMIASIVRQHLTEGTVVVPPKLVFDFQNGFVGKEEDMYKHFV
jgi:hypothetical protein